jgi:hypothetical protein
MITKQHRRQHTVPAAKILAFAAVILLFSCSQTAVAQQWTTNGNDISNANTGNVGIGTTTPAQKLEVSASSPLMQMSDTAAGGIKMTLGINGGFAGFAPNRNLVTSAHYDTGKTTAGYFMFVGNGNSFHWWGTTPTNNAEAVERMRLDKDGNLGLGTTTPAYRFDVVAASQYVARFKKTDNTNGGIIVESAAGWNPNVTLAVNGVNKWYLVSNATSSDVLQFWDSPGTTPRFTLTQTGSLGLGTAAPGYKLDVQSGSINSSGGLCIAGDCKTSWSQVGGSQWTTSGTTINYSTGNVGIGIASPVYSLDVNGGVNSFRAKAATVSSNDAIATFENTSAIQMIVRGNGNVGIGTTTPTAKLHVAGDGKITGNLTVDGNIAAKYQDVAEWVPATGALPAGTVVTLNPTQANLVEPSSKAYDTRVAGVISARPGIVLGESGENKVLVATSGRVRIKVDATNAPIEIGDLLVTSEKEGIAMKSVPVTFGGVEIHRPGTLIGKALERWDKGTGEILVLLSLQ